MIRNFNQKKMGCNLCTTTASSDISYLNFLKYLESIISYNLMKLCPERFKFNIIDYLIGLWSIEDRAYILLF